MGVEQPPGILSNLMLDSRILCWILESHVGLRIEKKSVMDRYASDGDIGK